MYTAPTLRSACSSSSCRLPMCGVKGQSPLRSLGGSRGPFSHVREWPPYPHPHTVWGNHNLVICTPAVFSINFLVPTVSNATSSSASPPIGVTEMTSPSPNVLWWIWSPEEKLKQRRGGGGLLRREFLRRLRFWSALHDAVVARRALTVATVAARRIRASLVKARVAKAGRALRLTADPVGILRRRPPPKNARVH